MGVCDWLSGEPPELTRGGVAVACSYWFAEFHGQETVRQLEMHPRKPPVLLERGHPELCPHSLDDTSLAFKPQLEVTFNPDSLFSSHPLPCSCSHGGHSRTPTPTFIAGVPFLRLVHSRPPPPLSLSPRPLAPILIL